MSGTDEVVGAVLVALHQRVELGRTVVKRGAPGLSLEGIGTTLETLVDVLDLVGEVVEAVNARTTELREREVTERREGSALETLDQALLHLSYGQEVLGGARHLVGAGWGEVVRVIRGEV